MKKVRILVVEDEILVADDICYMLETLGYEPLEPVMSYTQAIQSIEEDQPDMAILDVNLIGQKDGIDLAETINKHYKIPFIFLTANADNLTVERAKKVNPPAYLVKPFKKDNLFTSIEMALSNFSNQNQDTDSASNGSTEDELLIKDAIFVKNKYTFQKVRLEEIEFIKSDHVYIELYTTNGEKHVIRGSLTSFEQKLPAHFFRVHRSYLINLHFLETINPLNVIVGKSEIPLAKNYKSELMEKVRTE